MVPGMRERKHEACRENHAQHRAFCERATETWDVNRCAHSHTAAHGTLESKRTSDLMRKFTIERRTAVLRKVGAGDPQPQHKTRPEER
eukprot:2926254-Rhodomonas_salina.3